MVVVKFSSLRKLTSAKMRRPSSDTLQMCRPHMPFQIAIVRKSLLIYWASMGRVVAFVLLPSVGPTHMSLEVGFDSELFATDQALPGLKSEVDRLLVAEKVCSLRKRTIAKMTRISLETLQMCRPHMPSQIARV
mmetsp:Transcript_2200/g.3797  ORF Transcript_2200/g.3797 Transcript_2200/m.3797 type:complete len:134 (-) Transcript_2200:1019-1420(-)